MSRLFFQASDVWLFRDGRPFDVGIGYRAQSLFPPFPTVIQGAIRSHQLNLMKVDLHNKNDVRNAVGDTEDYLQLRLRGPFLAKKTGKNICLYYPLPADAVVKSTDASNKFVSPASKPVPPSEGVLSSQKDLWIMGLDDSPIKSSGNFWLTQDDFLKYIKRESVVAIPERNLFVRERRVGIGITAETQTATSEALFEVEYIRPQKDVGLLVDMEGYSWPRSGMLRMGGIRGPHLLRR